MNIRQDPINKEDKENTEMKKPKILNDSIIYQTLFKLQFWIQMPLKIFCK